MAGYLVITTHNLKDLVDGIFDYHPPVTGGPEFKGECGYLEFEDGKLWYKYKFYDNKHGISQESEPSQGGTTLFNQIARLRGRLSNEEANINIFIVTTLTETYESKNFSIKQILEIIENTFGQYIIINVSIFLVILAFNPLKPEAPVDPEQTLDAIIESSTIINNFQKDINNPFKIIVIDNIDLNQAAFRINIDALIHYISDLITIISSEQTAGMFNGLIAASDIFAIGYSAYYYHFNDVKRLAEFLVKRKNLDYALKGNRGLTNNFEHISITNIDLNNPNGLEVIKNQLSKKYAKRNEFQSLEELDSSNIYREIDQILEELQPYAKEMGLDYKTISQIFTSFKVSNPELLTESEKNFIKEEIEKYNVAIQNFISNHTKIYNDLIILMDSLKQKENGKNAPVENASVKKSLIKTVWNSFNKFAQKALSRFKKVKSQKVTAENIAKTKSELPLKDRDWFHSKLNELRKIDEEIQKYEELCKKVNELQNEKRTVEQKISCFKLTIHTKVHTVIKLPELKDYLTKKIEEKYDRFLKEDEIPSFVDKICNGLEKYNWDNPFPFSFRISDEHINLLVRESELLYHLEILPPIDEAIQPPIFICCDGENTIQAINDKIHAYPAERNIELIDQIVPLENLNVINSLFCLRINPVNNIQTPSQ